ncbi:hypothetical protein [Myceligenerans indicum]|uniref:Uncharacterized protein n=1 Tax=Myceligenerans indicum TaxID=2593663 RepID=A0ABS1LMA2_9MICO|nr:hypothetical protein [Myceligenerans indicum]MBL0887173.1 hypothetical protein [Myceligenerans indicum]
MELWTWKDLVLALVGGPVLFAATLVASFGEVRRIREQGARRKRDTDSE